MIPVKPFNGFKWRWLSTTPTEGLLQPSVFLGVLRAFANNQGRSPGDINLLDDLKGVMIDTRTDVDLVRTPERNLIRNSGQYWKGTGLLKPTRGSVELTSLGLQVATSELSQAEFAALIIHQTILPSKQTFPEDLYQKWIDSKIRIKPFILIMQTMIVLAREHGIAQAYLTTDELTKIIIPLSGSNTELSEYPEAVYQFRIGALDIAAWPNCTPEANDKRMAREFLYFLDNFGICESRLEDGVTKFCLLEVPSLYDISEIDVATEVSHLNDDKESEIAVKETIDSALPTIIERQRSVASVISRPNQARFRKEILSHSGGCCLITGDNVAKVLEAAHIIPVSEGGGDELGNGLCLRVDIRMWLDSSLLRIMPNV